ncbi:hypothetical protein DRQ36_08740 [bacterium]|nr:MAG: hypothetical protein DRQ36_08740 [bacterium]
MARFTAIFAVTAFVTISYAQPYPNLATDSFGALKYTLAIDSETYSRPSTMNIYFMVRNITDSLVHFECPSAPWSSYRVELRDSMVAFFPEISLPVVLYFDLAPDESIDIYTDWDTAPATEDTTYKLWAFLGAYGVPAGSLYVEFTMSTAGIYDEFLQPEMPWFVPNPPKSDLHFVTPGKYELFDILGKRTATINAPAIIDVSNYPRGIYLLRKAGTTECRKLVITN